MQTENTSLQFFNSNTSDIFAPLMPVRNLLHTLVTSWRRFRCSPKRICGPCSLDLWSVCSFTALPSRYFKVMPLCLSASLRSAATYTEKSLLDVDYTE